MKIALDARMYGPENTGIGRYVMELTHGLMKHDTKNEYILLLKKKYYETLEVPYNWKKVLADIPHYSLSEQLILPFVLYRIKPDFVHFLHLNVPLFYRKSFIVTIHDMTMHWQGKDATTLPLPIYYAKRMPYKIIFRNAVFFAKKLIVPTNAVKKEIHKYYKVPEEKVAAIYEGVSSVFNDTPSKTKSFEIKEPYFLYVGNVYPHKNLPLAVDAIKDLNESGLKAKLVIVCARSVFRKRLQEIISENKAEDYVSFMENVSDSKLANLYKNALAFLYPTKSEGFGLPGLEAMSMGTPVIASDIPVLREVYKSNAYFFDPMSKPELVRVMKVFVKEKKDNKSTQKNVLKNFVKQYSWSVMVKDTIKVYESCYSLR